MLIAVNYHYIRPSYDYPFPGIHGITPHQFEAQLKELSKVGKFVGAADIRAALRGEASLPARAFIVTLDDGLREQYDYAWEVLIRLGIPGIFFVNTGPIANSTVSMVHKIHLLRAHMAPVDFMAMLHHHAQANGLELGAAVAREKAMAHYRYDSAEAAQLKYLLNFLMKPEQRDQLMEVCFQKFFRDQEAEISRKLYMDVKQLRELGAHDAVGSHAHEHLPLGFLPPDQIREQISLSLDYLQAWAGVRPYAMSYPYGSKEASSLEAGEIAANLGIDFSFTTERAANPDLADRLFLARFDNNDLPGGKAARWAAAELFDSVPLSQMHKIAL